MGGFSMFDTTDQKICRYCVHFVQHYVRFTRRDGQMIYDEVDCGHCVQKRVKHRHPDAKACENYKEVAVKNPPQLI